MSKKPTKWEQIRKEAVLDHKVKARKSKTALLAMLTEAQKTLRSWGLENVRVVDARFDNLSAARVLEIHPSEGLGQHYYLSFRFQEDTAKITSTLFDGVKIWGPWYQEPGTEGNRAFSLQTILNETEIWLKQIAHEIVAKQKA